MTLAVRGASSRIAEELFELIPRDEDVVRVDRTENIAGIRAQRYLFCQGFIQSRAIWDQSRQDQGLSFLINASQVIESCDKILEWNDVARICVLGSESGESWSFDGSYAAAKAGLHRYVETKRLRTHDQQLICVAPTIIRDAGMTTRRNDLATVDQRALQHPKGRFLLAEEVARLIHFCLYQDQGYLTGQVIRMNGGSSTCR